MVKAVIFDLDDTLISEKQYIESGYSHIASILSEKFQIDEKTLFAELMDLFNENPTNVFNRLLSGNGIDYSQEMIINLVQEYRNHLPNIKFYDDVLPCLEMLKEKGIEVGIITDGYANAQRKKLSALNAHYYFEKIIVTDELGREFWKPHPKAFELMKDKFNVEFDEMIYVGDNPEKDFYISEIYPIITVRIQRESSVYETKQYKNDIKEKFLIDKLQMIEELL